MNQLKFAGESRKPYETSNPEDPIFQPFLDAVEDSRKIEIVYSNDIQPRILSVHIMRTGKNFEISFEGIQNHNPSKPEDDGVWKTFRLDRVKSIRVLENRFVPDTEFDPTVSRYSKGMIAHVPVFENLNANLFGNGFFPITNEIDGEKRLSFY